MPSDLTIPDEEAGTGDRADPRRLAHDLDNVLQAVASGLNLLEDAEDPFHRDVLLARMREAVARGAELAREIRALGDDPGD